MDPRLYLLKGIPGEAGIQVFICSSENNGQLKGQYYLLRQKDSALVQTAQVTLIPSGDGDYWVGDTDIRVRLEACDRDRTRPLAECVYQATEATEALGRRLRTSLRATKRQRLQQSQAACEQLQHLRA